MSDQQHRIVIADLRGGRNGTDPAISLADFHCADALNVDFFASTGPRRRNGSTALSMSSATFTGKVSSLARHVPGTDETLAELWGMDDAATPLINRLAGGTTWAAPTLKDVPTGNGWDLTTASLNGKLFMAYKSGSARLHAFDPNASGGAQVKRVGLAAMGVPSIANTGGGTYAATLRYYRTRAAIQSAGVTTYLSEPTTGVAFTPSGAGTAARVTQGTLPGEGETHWVVEVALDNATFYVLSTIAIGTTTYDDSAVTSTYNANPLSVTVGTYTLPKSYRFIASDQSRLIGFGSYTTTDRQDTLEFTGVVGASNIGDDERIPVGNSLTLDENASGVPTGLVGPVNGAFFAFKYSAFYKLTPTGVSTAPYQPLKISGTIGAIGPKAIFIGEDESGNPCIYFMSAIGPYRYGFNGLEYLGHNVEDRTVGANGGVSLNLSATKVVSHGVWYPLKRQAIFYIATGANNDPNERIVLGLGHVQSGASQPIPDGWVRDDGPAARCSVLFSNTVGAAMSHDLKPYYGLPGTNDAISKADTGNQDTGVNYQSYIVSKAYMPDGLGGQCSVNGIGVAATAQSGVSLTATLTAESFNGGLVTTTDTCDLTAINGESRVFRRFGSAVQTQPVTWFQVQIGDGAAANVAWQMDQTVIGWSIGTAVV